MFASLKKEKKDVEPITQTPAESRKQQASERARHLGQEDARMRTRLTETRDERVRLRPQILDAVRAGEDTTPLRARDAELVALETDLTQIIQTIDQELSIIGVELRTAELACVADRYNPLVDQQEVFTRRRDEVVRDFIAKIRDVQADAEAVARQQQGLHRAIGLPDQVATPAHIANLYLRDILHLLQTGNPVPTDYAAANSDWTLRRMTDQGELETRVLPAPERMTGTGPA